MEILEIMKVPYYKRGKGIHIKKKNRGKFTEYCGGEVTNECIQKAKKSKNPTLRKRATFAENARGWSKKHQKGGSMTQKQIAQTTEYGWEGQDNLKERQGKFSSVNPGHSFYNPFHWFGDGWRYIMGENRDEFSTPHEEAMYFRYMGGKRDMEHLPHTSVRFSRDYDENNKVNKTKEFVGVPKDQKEAVRDYVIPTMQDDLEEGEWVQVKDDVRFNRDVRGTGNRLSAYGKFGLRNNNNSGIYDIVDTYDFPDWIPIPDRNKGYELEVRDTIWTKDAKPELYRTEKGYYPYNKQPQK